MSRHHEWLYPRLRAFPDAERPEVLRKAKGTAFDVVELVGLALSLVLVTALTRYGAGELTAVERLAAVVVNFAVALVLLGMLAGPFLVRRIRRGIDRQLQSRSLP
jgi:hypothetical protein